MIAANIRQIAGRVKFHLAIPLSGEHLVGVNQNHAADVGVNKNPACLCRVPILADPMIAFVGDAGLEIIFKSHAHSGGDAFVTQQRYEEDGEIAAHADLFFSRLARNY